MKKVGIILNLSLFVFLIQTAQAEMKQVEGNLTINCHGPKGWLRVNYLQNEFNYSMHMFDKDYSSGQFKTEDTTENDLYSTSGTMGFYQSNPKQNHIWLSGHHSIKTWQGPFQQCAPTRKPGPCEEWEIVSGHYWNKGENYGGLMLDKIHGGYKLNRLETQVDGNYKTYSDLGKGSICILYWH